MELPGGDPKELFNTVGEELKKKFDEAGMGEVDGFVKKLEEVKGFVEKGPAAAIDSMKELVDGFKKKIESLLEDPSSLAPSGSALAKCATWYGNSVCKKLKAFNTDVEAMLAGVQDLIKELDEPIKKLADTMKTAMGALDKSIKKLVTLPSDVTDIAGKIAGPEDVANVDTESMKAALDVSSISEPLECFCGLKAPLVAAAEAVTKGVQRIIDFLQDAPATVQKAFAIPVPCCCCSSCWLSQAPAALTQLNTMLDGMKALDLSPAVKGFEAIQQSICNLDVEKVKAPVQKFSEEAAAPVDSLDAAVQAAKLATGGGGAMGLLNQAKGMMGF